MMHDCWVFPRTNPHRVYVEECVCGRVSVPVFVPANAPRVERDRLRANGFAVAGELCVGAPDHYFGEDDELGEEMDGNEE